MTSDGSGARIDLTRSSRCICGGIYAGDWCPACVRRYGEQRRPVHELDAPQQLEELILMVRPLAIPVSSRWRRFVELAAAIMPGQVPAFDDFLHLEGAVEVELARRGGRPPAFAWPPARVAGEEPHRERDFTQVLGVPAVDPAPE